MQNSQDPHDYGLGLFMIHKESKVFIFIAAKAQGATFQTQL